ncbi:MAG: M23 family metallopeptidase [Magnetococcales bacterium]|nr:M23 family metallopeptidase [Magnetococcales bacterium]MBF0263067.1 M23 family metallopeptidase [Magnetococcales bacterium]
MFNTSSSWRMHPIPLLACLIALVPWPLLASSLELSGDLHPGMAVLLKVRDLPPGARLSGTLDREPFPITPQGVALIALDMERQPAKVTLEVVVTPPKGAPETLTRMLTVPKRSYKEEHIDLPKKKVDLDQPDQARAARETAAISATYRLREGRVGFEKGFRQPASGRFSGVFGSRRVLNGQPRKPHNGVDIAAPKGTPVTTIAPGTVVLAGHDYFFTGNTLVIHHGHGVISLYAHLDRMEVSQGQWVEAGTPIGAIGMTGRATGPHLHWGVLVRGARVDPMALPGIRPAQD